MSAGTKLIALRVAAKVVVIVQNENSRVWITGAQQVSVRNTVDNDHDHHQVQGVASVCDRAGGPQVIGGTVAQSMSIIVRTIMAAAHAGQRGRIVARLVLGEGGYSARPSSECGRAGRKGDAVEEIAPR